MTKKTLHKVKRIPKVNWFDLGGSTDINNIILGSGNAGGSVGMQGSNGFVNTLSGTQKAQALLGLGTGNLLNSGSIGGIAGGVASAIGSAINPSGNSTTVGNVLQSVGSLASNIPGVGGLIGAGVNLIGGLTNAAFGSNINEDFINQTDNLIEQQASFNPSAISNNQLLADWNSYRNMDYVEQDEVGSDGWFSNKAKNLTKELNSKIDEANKRAISSFSNAANRINQNNILTALSNYSAYGGPLTMRYTGLMSPFGNQFKDGGGIHIKKANRGKFTSYCGGKVTSECIQRGLNSSNPTTRKRANFARNARKWKHSFGGELNTQGGDFSNGLIYINSGGTHEENPNEGVQLGVDNQGIPNLVEEGEVVWNDYVFSNRLKPSKNMKKKNKYRGNTFADIAKNIQKESEERPNDPISKRGLEAGMGKLSEIQENMRQKRGGNKFAKGGEFLRYTPIIGHAVGAFSDLFSEPDYSAADRVGSVDITPSLVDYTPVGTYLSYKPFDKNYYLNKLDASAGATRRAIQNTGGNRAAIISGLLASDYNYGNQLGNLTRQAEEYNQQLRERTAGFNRQTDLFNSEMGLKAGVANAESRNKATQLRLSQANTEAALRQAARDAYNTRRSNNINVLFDELGSLGTEQTYKNWLNTLAASGVLRMDADGNYIAPKSNGGKIRTKKKKGYTYG